MHDPIMIKKNITVFVVVEQYCINECMSVLIVNISSSNNEPSYFK